MDDQKFGEWIWGEGGGFERVWLMRCLDRNDASAVCGGEFRT